MVYIWYYVVNNNFGVIRSFRDRETGYLFHREASRRWVVIARLPCESFASCIAREPLNDVRFPAGNPFEALRKGDRAGQHSIRVIDQYRICFRWEAGQAYNMELTDYHN